MNSPRPAYGWQNPAARNDAALFDEGLRQHMLRVYNYMGLGLVVTGCRLLHRRQLSGALRADLLDAR